MEKHRNEKKSNEKRYLPSLDIYTLIDKTSALFRKKRKPHGIVKINV